jgi:hypothetical protein
MTLKVPYLRPRSIAARNIPLLLVATGLPLLSGGRGGIGVFAGPSAGFLFMYPVITYHRHGRQIIMVDLLLLVIVKQ